MSPTVIEGNLLHDPAVVYARRQRRLMERRLPPGLRSDIARLRRDDLACGVLDALFARVRELADAGGVVRRDYSFPALFGIREYVPAVHERRILGQLDRSSAFRRKVRREVRELLRTAHVTRTAPPVVVPGFVGTAPAPDAGTLFLRSDIGLGAASFLDAEPEELNVLVHDRIVHDWRARRELPDIGLDEPLSTNVLVVGSGAGGFAKVVASRAQHFPRLVVHEVEPLVADRTDLACVADGSIAEGAPYDYALVVLRCPAVGGAANHGRIYGKHGDHLSKLGPARWSGETIDLLRSVRRIMSEGAMVFVVAPRSVRTDRGYDPVPALLDIVLDGLRGLGVVEQHRIIEVDPRNKPFVGTRRPDRWLLVGRKDSEATS